MKKGHLHPITKTIREIYAVFQDLGFVIAEGPELEREFYNFDALNVPADHPSRDMQDTFWIKELVSGEQSEVEDVAEKLSKIGDKMGKRLLTTQTSAVQVRYMEKHKPPFRVLVPGKVYRNEATDATHEVQFHQIEAMYVDKGVSMAHLKFTLENAFKKIYGPKTEIRFRPSFFPFTEPSVEVDVKWRDKWLEVVGAGMIHPHVLRSAGLDPKEWGGFAFAFGLDRLVMLKYGLDDIRLLYNGDLRLVRQF